MCISIYHKGFSRLLLFCVLIVVTVIAERETPYAMQGKWVPLQDYKLVIEPDSALDFSKIFKQDEIREPVGITIDGHLGLKGDQSQRKRFFCASLNFSPPHGKFPTHEFSDQYAHQMKKRGYNLARLHFIEATLMTGRRSDFDYDPEQVDRFHYLLYALKRNGIRWMIDAATSENGAYGNIKPHRWVNKHQLKIGVYFDSEAQDHWRRMVETILCVPNAYTKTIIMKDPGLLAITLFNESGLGFLSRENYPDLLEKEYVKWLKAEVKTEDYKIPKRYEISNRSAHMQNFIGKVENQTAKWMSNYLREKGFTGLICAYNNGKSLQAAASRANLEVVAAHAYHDHPSKFSNSGSRQDAVSSLDNALGYVRTLAATRFIGKPFIVEEYDHPYWNPFRREAGIAVPSFAAFQDWDVICRYTNPVELVYDKGNPPRSRSIYPFGIGMDPVAVAGETLGVLLFRRGDVNQAKNFVSFLIGPEISYGNEGGVKTIPSKLSLLGLETGIGIEWRKTISNNAFFNLNEMMVSRSPFKKLIFKNAPFQEFKRELIKTGILSKDSGGGAKEKNFESDTKQIVVEPIKKRMIVRTPRTQAVVFENNEPIEFANFKIRNCDTNALVALTSVDEKIIAKSDRLLLIVATDAVNSGGTFSPDRKVLFNLGELPILVRVVRLELEFEKVKPYEWSLYSLSMSGMRKEIIPVKVTKKGTIVAEIDTGALKNGPSIFFELVREKS